MRTIDLGELGEAIAALRGERSQTQVARRGGISRASWSLYELGKRRPRETSLASVLRGLGCSREQLEEAVWKIHRRRLVEEALGLGYWPRSALVEEDPSAPGEVQVGEPVRRPPRLSLEQPDALPRELRAILARHVACLEDVLLYLLRKGA